MLRARTWERHIDIDYNDVEVSPYNSKPVNCNDWYLAYHQAKELCGSSPTSKRIISIKETKYLDELVRGVYAKKKTSIKAFPSIQIILMISFISLFH